MTKPQPLPRTLIYSKTVKELHKLASDLEIKGRSSLNKSELRDAIERAMWTGFEIEAAEPIDSKPRMILHNTVTGESVEVSADPEPVYTGLSNQIIKEMREKDAEDSHTHDEFVPNRATRRAAKRTKSKKSSGKFKF